MAVVGVLQLRNVPVLVRAQGEQTDKMPQRPLKAIAGDPKKPLIIGDIELGCYVLENKERVISQNDLLKAIGATKGGAQKEVGAEIPSSKTGIPQIGPQTGFNGDRLPRFFENLWLKPYISDEYRLVLKSPIVIENPKGGLIHGYPASILPKLCAVILKANEDGATTSRQTNVVKRARILLQGLATVGIIGLVDEATG